MELSLTVLGSSGSYPGPGRACSSYLVEGGGVRVWVDAGSGSLANLQRHVALSEVDAVIISHEHADHWQDIEGFAIGCHLLLRLPPIPIYAPAGLRGRMQGPAGAFLWNDVTDYDRIRIGGLEVSFHRTDHGPETLAMRFDRGGRALGYSADSGSGWSLEALGRGLDLALCEATYLADREGTLQHLSARQAGVSARAAGAGRLVITHLQPGVDPERARAEAEAAFGAPVEVAIEGLRIEL
ncbi:MAG: MBL fold metallo-hydrolase [Acidimicrobiales bacterium]